MIISDVTAFHGEIARRVGEMLLTFLPADHHDCIPKMIARLSRLKEMEGLVAVGQEFPEEMLNMMVEQIAKTVAASHMIDAAKEEAERRKARGILSEGMSKILPGVFLHRVETEKWWQWEVIIGQPSRWSFMFSRKK